MRRDWLLATALVFGLACPAWAQTGIMADNGTVRLFNLGTGAIIDSHPVTGQQALFGMLAFDSSLNRLYTIDGFNDGASDRLFRIDPFTGTGTIVGNTGFNWNFRFLDFNPADGLLYGATDNALYTLNTATGAGTFLRNITGASLNQLTCMGIRADGQAFGIDFVGGSQELFAINLATGAATLVGTVSTTGSQWYNDLTFGPGGVLYATSLGGSNNELYTINPATGARTFLYNVGTGGFSNGVAFLAPIPEPATVALLAGGVGAGLAWRRYRRRPAPLSRQLR